MSPPRPSNPVVSEVSNRRDQVGRMGDATPSHAGLEAGRAMATREGQNALFKDQTNRNAQSVIGQFGDLTLVDKGTPLGEGKNVTNPSKASVQPPRAAGDTTTKQQTVLRGGQPLIRQSSEGTSTSHTSKTSFKPPVEGMHKNGDGHSPAHDIKTPVVHPPHKLNPGAIHHKHESGNTHPAHTHENPAAHSARHIESPHSANHKITSEQPVHDTKHPLSTGENKAPAAERSELRHRNEKPAQREKETKRLEPTRSMNVTEGKKETKRPEPAEHANITGTEKGTKKPEKTAAVNTGEVKTETKKAEQIRTEIQPVRSATKETAKTEALANMAATEGKAKEAGIGKETLAKNGQGEQREQKSQKELKPESNNTQMAGIDAKPKDNQVQREQGIVAGSDSKVITSVQERVGDQSNTSKPLLGAQGRSDEIINADKSAAPKQGAQEAVSVDRNKVSAQGQKEEALAQAHTVLANANSRDVAKAIQVADDSRSGLAQLGQDKVPALREENEDERLSLHDLHEQNLAINQQNGVPAVQAQDNAIVTHHQVSPVPESDYSHARSTADTNISHAINHVISHVIGHSHRGDTRHHDHRGDNLPNHDTNSQKTDPTHSGTTHGAGQNGHHDPSGQTGQQSSHDPSNNHNGHNDPSGKGQDPNGQNSDPAKDPSGKGTDPNGKGQDPNGKGQDPNGTGNDPSNKGNSPDPNQHPVVYPGGYTNVPYDYSQYPYDERPMRFLSHLISEMGNALGPLGILGPLGPFGQNMGIAPVNYIHDGIPWVQAQSDSSIVNNFINNPQTSQMPIVDSIQAMQISGQTLPIVDQQTPIMSSQTIVSSDTIYTQQAGLETITSGSIINNANLPPSLTGDPNLPGSGAISSNNSNPGTISHLDGPNYSIQSSSDTQSSAAPHLTGQVSQDATNQVNQLANNPVNQLANNPIQYLNADPNLNGNVPGFGQPYHDPVPVDQSSNYNQMDNLPSHDQIVSAAEHKHSHSIHHDEEKLENSDLRNNPLRTDLSDPWSSDDTRADKNNKPIDELQHRLDQIFNNWQDPTNSNGQRPDSRLVDNRGTKPSAKSDGLIGQLITLVNDLNNKKQKQTAKIYIVQKGDTSEIIAAKILRDAKLALLIYIINKGNLVQEASIDWQDCKLTEGMALYLPSNEEIINFRSAMPRGAGQMNATSNGAQWHFDQQYVKGVEDRRRNVERLLGPLNGSLVDAKYDRETGRKRVTVRLGDTLRSIALKNPNLNDVSLWKLLASCNGLSPAVDSKGSPIAILTRGMILQIPGEEEIVAYRASQAALTRAHSPRKAIAQEVLSA